MIAALREFFRHRHHPPALIPDRVTWTRDLPDDEHVGRFLAASFDEGWLFDRQCKVGDDTLRITLVRFDGKYRWRDDGCKGY
jgi:hypothetical protein